MSTIHVSPLSRSEMTHELEKNKKRNHSELRYIWNTLVLLYYLALLCKFSKCFTVCNFLLKYAREIFENH